MAVSFRKDEAPVAGLVVLREARNGEGGVHDSGSASHGFARLFFEMLVMFFGVSAEIAFEEIPLGFVS